MEDKHGRWWDEQNYSYESHHQPEGFDPNAHYQYEQHHHQQQQQPVQEDLNFASEHEYHHPEAGTGVYHYDQYDYSNDPQQHYEHAGEFDHHQQPFGHDSNQHYVHQPFGHVSDQRSEFYDPSHHQYPAEEHQHDPAVALHEQTSTATPSTHTVDAGAASHSPFHDAYGAVESAIDHTRSAFHTALDAVQASQAYGQARAAVEHALEKVHGTEAYGQAKAALAHAVDTVKGSEAYSQATAAIDHTKVALDHAYDRTKLAVEGTVEGIKSKLPPQLTGYFSQFKSLTDKNKLIFYGCSCGFSLLVLIIIIIALRPKRSNRGRPAVADYENLVGAFTVAAPDYDYTEGPRGVLHWGQLYKDWFLCSSGDQQSPISIVSTDAILDKSLKLDKSLGYPMGSLKSGRYLYQLDFPLPGGNLVITGQRFRLFKVHFHMPSEHMVDSKRYKLEMQLIFISDDGQGHAVIAVFFDPGPVSNPFLSEIFKWKPTTQLDTSLLNLGTTFFRYWGSLTVPPCTQNVIWTIMTEVVPASEDQFNTIMAAMKDFNARPTQDLRGRKVSKSG